MNQNTIDWTKPVRTKARKSPVEIKFTDGRGDYPVGGYVGANTTIYSWTKNGHNGDRADLDVENAPEKVIKYWNVYPNTLNWELCDSIEEADQIAGRNRLARIRVEFEVGQFDE